ncbi:HEAT repeat domain-containing protein [Kitasatospora sp. NPDC093679]|uniref:HEAT repeat domain-containing protein n=1 Tax=Kitasatospora sp. NPDC093679 TaxID=3154983 RepID=UPI00343439D9
MTNELAGVDWASMHHAYGTAEEIPDLLTALRSTDAQERDRALGRFYSAVHHQGDVYPCTTAALPFLFNLAQDIATPDRPGIVELLVSIATTAVERCEDNYIGEIDYAGAATALRGRADVFVRLADDPDTRVRRAAIPALALLLDDVDRATALLRDRLPAEHGLVERLAVVAAMASLALRLPSAVPAAVAWFEALAADPAATPTTRLAAVVQRARCVPDRIGDDSVDHAIALLREAQSATTPPCAWADPPRTEEPQATGDNVPPQIAAAFAELDRAGRVHAPTTDLLRTFHEALAHRIPQRTALLAEQLRSPDPGTRLDALRMSRQLMQSWRGNHTPLIELVAGQLAAHPQVAAEAAEVLGACHQLAGPAREALAAQVVAHRATHGPDVWAAPQPQLRRAHQEAVLALARLGDIRAVPSLLTALDGDMDAWRAVQVAGSLPQAADLLVPRLCKLLRRLDLAQQWVEMSANALLAALAEIGDPQALPVITDTLSAAVDHEQWRIVSTALEALAAFGPAATPALPAIRPLTRASDPSARPAAVAALWAAGKNVEEVMPLLLELLDDTITFRIWEAADVLGEIGPAAAAALPQLHQHLAHEYEWVRVHCAAALWEIAGEAEAPAVLNTLLQAWAKNGATANHVVACLDRMGEAARPALPQLRAELALARRGGRFENIENDEALQQLATALIGRLT